ncbi:helix-turn-helix domain-containing protein [Hymenobacter tibetensis]|uniref:Helix-turn-helix domain-containing protein n=1 Tax=Hymenobacter tibetensis TaxID=497967 RepID=A0ABY4D6Y0_9BACT|nr:helix-turn-helix domain-containing protein [Hymenobacter tibetensis]UOG76991.1 helix-turn-helix domain-containing protein [Hymenobacter tibetensis]
MFSAARIIAVRKRKGLSQEVLAEKSGVSLRTIQRVEQGDTTPRGYTVQALAMALDVDLDVLQEQPEPETAPAPVLATEASAASPALRSDPQFLQLLNLSALSFLVLPFLNLVVPLLLWRARRHDTEHVAELGRRVLGFQILWQVLSFFAYMLMLLVHLVLARSYNIVLPGAFVGIMVLTYALNALTVGYYALQLRRGRLDVYRFRL